MRVHALFWLLFSCSAWAGGCGSFRVPGGALDLAPPAGYLDSCSRDEVLCRKLTAGYPPSVKTLAHFVTDTEWKEYRAGTRSGFSRYLIAQAALTTSPSKFEDLRAYLRSRNGEIPDHTMLTSVLESTGRVNLGILEDSPDAIAIGVISRFRSPPPLTQELVLASSNIALLTRGQVLSLYAFVDISGGVDPSPMRELTRRWLSCLRGANT